MRLRRGWAEDGAPIPPLSDWFSFAAGDYRLRARQNELTLRYRNTSIMAA